MFEPSVQMECSSRHTTIVTGWLSTFVRFLSFVCPHMSLEVLFGLETFTTELTGDQGKTSVCELMLLSQSFLLESLSTNFALVFRVI